MSALSALASSTDDDDIDDNADDQDTGTEERPTERPGDALVRLMLDAALTPKLRRLMQAAARLIIIKTPDDRVARMMDTYLSGCDPSVAVQAYTELTRSGGRSEPHGQDELRKLECGRSVILISPDPERLLVPEALATADAVITLPPPDLAMVRQTIRAVTGRQVRGLQQADIEGLGIADLMAAIRPGLYVRGMRGQSSPRL